MNTTIQPHTSLLVSNSSTIENCTVYLVQSNTPLNTAHLELFSWLLSTNKEPQEVIDGTFIGPRREIITPWSTNATDILRNLGISGVTRVESFRRSEKPCLYDPMLEEVYEGITTSSLDISQTRTPFYSVTDLRAFNEEAALALSNEELEYLEEQQEKLGRYLTDAEVYAFGQINSEHCRHKIFNGTFIIDGQEKPHSLFSLIKSTSKTSPQQIISAYKDNVAFIKGPKITQFHTETPSKPSRYHQTTTEAVLSLKAETHNFPTTVEPFYGASTGSGGEIRDRMAGGIGSIPLAGTAVYMTASPRLNLPYSKTREKYTKPRRWKYQSPENILIKASNGASDFGNKFGQPLINGSLLTFEMALERGFYAYDRTVMMAGGVGYAKGTHAQKKEAQVGDLLVLLGGENYRIGMAGGSVSSVDTGRYGKTFELSAVQRANPEMQKRVYNVVRGLVEEEQNPIVLIHDHGAGGHVNCFTELLEPLGGKIHLKKLPLGDPTLSAKEILCNESQERMGLILPRTALSLLEALAQREQAPYFVVGEVSGDGKILFEEEDGSLPMDVPLSLLLGKTPQTLLQDNHLRCEEAPCTFVPLSSESFTEMFSRILSHETVGCKDWLTNKVDRSVTGLVAQQQEVGPLHLPLANCGVMALDFSGTKGIATAIGHAPSVGLLDASSGAVLSVVEALSNILWAPLEEGLDSIVLSANWMWPCRQQGEDARLYDAVEALSTFCKELGIAVPTGKDSLSMTMNYDDGATVRAPGTVIVTAVGQCSNIRQIVTPNLKEGEGTRLLWVDLTGKEGFPLGGSIFSQEQNTLGGEFPTIHSASHVRKVFSLTQELITSGVILAGHDVSDGGILAAIAEMAIVGDKGVQLSLLPEWEKSPALLFSQKPSILLQVHDDMSEQLLEQYRNAGITAYDIGSIEGDSVVVIAEQVHFKKTVKELRALWFSPSAALDALQTLPKKAEERASSLENRRLVYRFPEDFSGSIWHIQPANPPLAAIVREKGTNGDRELAFALHAAGFEVLDLTMADLCSGKGTLREVKLAAFPGGFSNSDVLGAGKGWAARCLFHERARHELSEFFARPETLSIGVCNGCQLVAHLPLYSGEDLSAPKVQMLHNESGRFESGFVTVTVPHSSSIFLKPLEGAQLGVWIAHGEGRFHFINNEVAPLQIALTYSCSSYPMNPNGSPFNTAGITTPDGRHLALMPHLERSLFPWQWPYYPENRVRSDSYSPWIMAFAAAKKWLSS